MLSRILTIVLFVMTAPLLRAEDKPDPEMPGKITEDAIAILKEIKSDDDAKSAEAKLKDIGKRMTAFRSNDATDGMEMNDAIDWMVKAYSEMKEPYAAMKEEFDRLKPVLSAEVFESSLKVMGLSERALSRPMPDFSTADAKDRLRRQITQRRAAKAFTNLKTIQKACVLYANSHDGNYPPDLQSLFEPKTFPLDTFKSKRSKSQLPENLAEVTPESAAEWMKANPDYLYFGAGKGISVGTDEILACENPAAVEGELAVVLGNGTTKMMPREELAEKIKR